MLDIIQMVKNLFKVDGLLKNVRVSFPNGEYDDICNDRLIKESLKFNESISNREEIKFGICESSQISFECVDVGNIKGMEIKVDIEIDVTSIPVALRPEECKTSDDVPFPYYPLPLGIFVVDECKRDAGFLKRKVVAYSKSSSFPSYDWWTSEEWYSPTGSTLAKDVNLDIINFIAATNQGMFDDSDRTPVSFTRTGQSFTVDIPITDSNNTTYNFRIEVYGEWAASIYNMNARPWPNTQRIGRVDKCVLSSNYESSMADAIAGFEAQGVSDDAIQQIMDIISYYRPFNVLNAYRDPNLYSLADYAPYHDSVPFTQRKGKQIQEGELFIMPWKLALYSQIVVSNRSGHAEQTFRVYLSDAGLNIDNYLQISEVTLHEGNRLTIPIMSEGNHGYYVRTFLKPILFLDIRALLEANLELMGCFGHIDRYGHFKFLSIINLVFDGLFPREDLYPSDVLYPKEFLLPIPVGVDADLLYAAVVKEDYVKSLWYEEYFIAFGGITCSYLSSEVLDENNNPSEVIYSERWIDDDRYLTYDVSDNEFIKSKTWTEQEISEELETIIAALKIIKFFPHELSCKGLPYIEAGDWVLASFNGNQVKTLCLSRTLSGIQALSDKMKSD